MQRISINAPYKTARDRIRRSADLQIGMEVYLNNDVIDEISPGDAGDLAGMLRDAGIPCTVHAPFMDLSPGGIDKTVKAVTREKLKKAVATANVLGARGIVCHGGFNKWLFDSRRQAWLDTSVETWGQILAEADKNLLVMIENIFEEEPSTLIELFKHFKEKNLFFCFDSGHFNLFSTVPLEAWLGPLRDHIREMHLHDNHGSSDEHLPIGRGTFPFRELKTFVPHLNNVIYTAEIHDESRAVESIKNLKEFLS